MGRCALLRILFGAALILCLGCLSGPSKVSFPEGYTPSMMLDGNVAEADGSHQAQRYDTGSDGISLEVDSGTVPSVAPDSSTSPSCINRRMDGDETDRDCGGEVCPPCGTRDRCLVASDCISGICRLNRCARARCGDGVINGNEACDDGNDIDTDDCTNDCREQTCGNGQIDPLEGSCDCEDGSVNLDGAAGNGCECVVNDTADTSCDGVDDDCDGLFDEDFESMLLEQSPCMPVDGEPDCVGAQVSTYATCSEGVIVPEEEPGECPLDEFTIDEQIGDCRPNEPCSATGGQQRSRTVCTMGEPSVREDTLPCDTGIVNGTVIANELSDCTNDATPCSAEGTQRRTEAFCEPGLDGLLLPQVRSFEQPCIRETEGLVLQALDPSPCGYGGPCYPRAYIEQRRLECRNNEPTPVVVSQEVCERRTISEVDCSCVAESGSEGLFVGENCVEYTTISGALTGDSDGTYLTMTCSITGSSCSVTNDSDTCPIRCPAGEDVSFCCANGLPNCGLERIQDPTYRIERIELSGLRGDDRCESDLEDLVECTRTTADRVRETSATCEAEPIDD